MTGEASIWKTEVAAAEIERKLGRPFTSSFFKFRGGNREFVVSACGGLWSSQVLGSGFSTCFSIVFRMNVCLSSLWSLILAP